jgi:hypothetical protein
MRQYILVKTYMPYGKVAGYCMKCAIFLIQPENIEEKHWCVLPSDHTGMHWCNHGFKWDKNKGGREW